MNQHRTLPGSTEADTGPTTADEATLHHIRFVEHASDEQTVLFEFADPTPSKAVALSQRLDTPPAAPKEAHAKELTVFVVPRKLKDDPRWRDDVDKWIAPTDELRAASPITIKVKNVEVQWRPGLAVIHAPPERAEPMLEALVEFAYFEGELRRLEGEIVDFWPEVEGTHPLAYEVKKNDPELFETVGQRMGSALERRSRYARIEPHLCWPPAHLPEAAQELGELLRDEARVEDRLEVVDGQLEVHENVFELSSQRISDYRLSREGYILEMIIIIVLVAESLLILGEILWCLE